MITFKSDRDIAKMRSLEGYTRLAPYQRGLLLGIRRADGGSQAVILDATTGEIEETLGGFFQTLNHWCVAVCHL